MPALKLLSKQMVSLLCLFFISSCVQPSVENAPNNQNPTQPSPTIEAGDEVDLSTTPTEEVVSPHFQLPYGVVYPFAASSWSEADRPKIHDYLAYLQNLGIDTVIQSFSSEGSDESWLIFLDEADKLGIRVISFLYPGGKWTDNGFDYASIEKFLKIVGNHPALLAYLGLHEPLEEFTSEQLREFYQTVKGISPDLPIAHYLSDMEWFDGNWRFPGRKFSEGICDICIIWYYPVRYKKGAPILEEKELIQVIQNNRQLLDDRAPDAQLWFLGQTYSMESHVRNLRMPSPEEMEKIFLLAANGGIDGFLWYPWSHNSYDAVLSDELMEPQRQEVQEIYQKYLASPSE